MEKRKLKKLHKQELKVDVHEQQESVSETEDSEVETHQKLNQNLVSLKSTKLKKTGFSDDNKFWLKPKEKKAKKDIQHVSICLQFSNL